MATFAPKGYSHEKPALDSDRGHGLTNCQVRNIIEIRKPEVLAES